MPDIFHTTQCPRCGYRDRLSAFLVSEPDTEGLASAGQKATDILTYVVERYTQLPDHEDAEFVSTAELFLELARDAYQELKTMLPEAPEGCVQIVTEARDETKRLFDGVVAAMLRKLGLYVNATR